MKNRATLFLSVGSHLLLIGAIAVALWAMTRGWDKPLLGPHSFRQTQTAMSAYYMAQDPRMFFDYITPVLGKPWRIPLELPVYQWMVARWHKLSGMPLDPSGKLISLVAWLFCFAPLLLLGRALALPPQGHVFGAVIALSSPLYLFWGAAFLIETTALFFALCMVAFALQTREKGTWFWAVCGILAGSLAATIKATTWAVAAGTGLLLVLFYRGLPRRVDAKRIAAAVGVLLVPLLPGKLWLAYGDSVKQANPFAREIILASSAKQAAWNYGTWEQKLDPATWQVIFRHISEQLLIPFPGLGVWFMLAVLVAGCVMAPRRIPLILVLFAGFAAGPVVFTNLYFEHSYYWCANGIWFLLAVGVALAGMWEGTSGVIPRSICLLLTIAIATSGFITWSRRFLPIITALPSQEDLARSWTRPVQNIVPEKRTVFYLGMNWNPAGHYYLARKGIAFPTSDRLPFPGKQIEESLALLGPEERLGAVVVDERFLTAGNQRIIHAFLETHDISKRGFKMPFGVFFPAMDLAGAQPLR